jgi:hypothetical protein
MRYAKSFLVAFAVAAGLALAPPATTADSSIVIIDAEGNVVAVGLVIDAEGNLVAI